MFNFEKSLSPDNTAFKQQRLPAWQPIVSAKSVFPIFFCVTLIFIPVGVVLLITSRNVVEFVHNYTECESLENPSDTCSSIRSNQFRMNESCTCMFNFTLSSPLPGDVFAYYGLSNFFQNHRRYLKSRDDEQLLGNHVTVSTVRTECQPYAWSLVNGSFRVTAPCGAIANSLFNDTFTLTYQGGMNVPFLRTGITWPTDYQDKFNNPSPVTDLNQAFSTYTKPIFWQTPVQFLDNSSIFNNGYQNEALIVWMRTAAFPTFRKTYGRLDRTDSDFISGLPAGDYSLTISYNFPVTSFFGEKRFILSTTSWMGGKNDFLGVAYIVFGCLSLAVGIMLCCIHNYANKIHAMHVDT